MTLFMFPSPASSLKGLAETMLAFQMLPKEGAFVCCEGIVFIIPDGAKKRQCFI